jgi:hypothetical protein
MERFVAMWNASAAKFSSYFNVGLPQQPTRTGSAAPKYCAIVAYRDATGLIHTYLGNPLVRGQQAEPDCERHLKTWAQKQTSLQDANPPAAAAWTQLSVNTMTNTTSKGNMLQETLAVYRLNTNDTQVDYYMVTKQTDSQPKFNHCTAGISCGWYATSRGLNIELSGLTDGVALFDHGPLAKNNSSTASFNVGISIAASPNASAGYSQSWSQSDVETDDTTQLGTLTASWSDKFNSGFSWSHPPNAIVGLWESDQAAIFTVPAGTTGFSFAVNDYAAFANDNGYAVPPTRLISNISCLSVRPLYR